MKDTKPQRDMQMQAQYREALVDESVNVYGVAKCFASKKPYKGLIASHIKPYILCVLEGDDASQFDPNNGLLLAKFIDDYFDKLLLTFDDEGYMIFSDAIPDEIKNEFQYYSLGNEIYNEKRKQYMKIHRSLFYYKNYMRHSDSGKKDLHLSIPYVDCGIRVYNGKTIICNEKKWEILPAFHLKAALAERAQNDIKFDVYSSGAEVFSAISQNKQYVLQIIPGGFNTPNQTLNVSDLLPILPTNDFKLSCTNYDIKDGFPERFYGYLTNVMRKQSDIGAFRKIICAALRGDRIEKYVIINGVEESINYLLLIIRDVLGSYVANISSPKIFRVGNPSGYEIPNCRLLVCNMKNKSLASDVMEAIADNRFFSPTVLNVDRYLPLFCYAGKRCADNSIVIELKRDPTNTSMDAILEEGGEILKWFLTEKDTTLDYSTSVLPVSAEGSVKEWFDTICEYTNDPNDKYSATRLYNSYQDYMIEKEYTPVSMKRFCIEIIQYANKKRTGAGIFYIGIRLKKQNHR